MKNKRLLLGAAAVMVCLLFLSGFRLALPEAERAEGDKFVGFHIVHQKLGELTEEGFQQIGDSDRSHWVEYGSEDVMVEGFGSVSFPREILVGVYNEETRRYDFPGEEGYNCFLAIRRDENGERYINGYTDMTESHLHMKVTDEGEENILTTALYLGAVTDPADYDYVLTAYRVYQMEDGTVYLDGTGNSYGGPGFTIRERSEYTTNVNGEKKQEIFEIEFALKDLRPVEEVQVVWFGERDTILAREPVPAKAAESEYTLTPPAGAAWGMVEERSEDGRVTRTVPTADGEGRVSHKLILPDEHGLGRAVYLKWEIS